MKDWFKVVGYLLSVLIVIMVFGWIVQGNSFFMYKVFAPQVEQVRHDTFKESQAYIGGMNRDIQDMQFKYQQATPEQKDTLAAVILQRTADYDLKNAPPDLRSFIEKLKRGER